LSLLLLSGELATVGEPTIHFVLIITDESVLDHNNTYYKVSVDIKSKSYYYYSMIDLKRLEAITLTNEELQAEVTKLTAEIGNLQVQISEYRQIVAELSQRSTDLINKK